MEPHTHCQICSKPVPLDEKFCSEKCREEYNEFIEKRKKKTYIFYVLLAGLLILIFLQLSGIW